MEVGVVREWRKGMTWEKKEFSKKVLVSGGALVWINREEYEV